MFSIVQDNENTESKRNSEISDFMPRIMADQEILVNRNYLNFKQRDVTNLAHNWVKEYA